MSNWPYKATRHSKAVVLAEAIRRGLFSTDAGETWLYMFHDIYGVAHFRHVDHRGYMQMLPDTEITSDRPAFDRPANDAPANGRPANDISANEHAADNSKCSEKRSGRRADRRSDQQSGKTRQKSGNAPQANDNANNSDQNGETKP